ncbi:MAG: hypothetical protein ABIG84_04365, partial [archaeon]
MRFDKVFVIAVFLLCVFVPESMALMVSTEKMDYVAGDSLGGDGIADSGVVNVTIKVYNSTDDLMGSSVVNTTGEDPNYFSFSIPITGNYTPGDYYFTAGDGSAEVSSSFSVLSEFLSFNAHIISGPDVKLVNTTYEVTGVSNYGCDFSEIFNQSISGVLHYGNISNLTGDGKNYSFVLVDEKENGTYDMVYIDDNGTFSDIWKSRHVGENVAIDVNYTIAEIEFSTGNKVLLAPSIEGASYSASDTVDLLIWVKNETHLVSGKQVNVSVVDKDDKEVSSMTSQTNTDGYVAVNFTAPSIVGAYFIKINDKPTEVFTVESFRLVGETTDLAGNPMFSFSGKSKIKVVARVKDVSGAVIKNAVVSAHIVNPIGTTVNLGTLSFDNNTNGYVKEVDLGAEISTGKYKVTIAAQYGGDTQQFLTGFETESVKLELMAINPLFIEEAEGPEAMVDSFAPGANVSIMVMLSDFSSGSIMEAGPESMGLIDIDNKSTGADECETRVKLVSVTDEKGVELNLSLINLKIMNLSSAVELLAVSDDEGPEDEMLSQCMVIFEAPDKAGVYKAMVRLKHPQGDKEAVSTFSLQKLYAAANPVDFKGDDFWFYEPNSSIKIKIKVTDLLTRADVPAGNITDAKIIEMYKVWPAFEDVFADESYVPNAAAANGTITFMSPEAEGFFMFKFKFKAKVGGVEEYGVGNGFFMLKKYMIWGNPQGCEPGKACITAHGEPITLTVNVVDIEKGSMMDLGKSGLTCSDNDNDGLPDCDGLEVNVDELWNEQLMKKMEKETDYNVSATSIRSSTANLTINPLNLPTGWYHVDLVLTDPVTSDTYFGWAWFEIRNFWVDVMTIEADDEGTLTAGWEKGNTYGVGDNVLFTVMAFDPKNKGENGPQPLNLSDISLESMSMMRYNGPPITLKYGTDYTYTKTLKFVTMPWEGPEGDKKEIQVINLTLLVNKTGEYMTNIKVTTTDGDSDIGDMWFDVSKFRVDMTHNGGDEEWFTTFSPTQVVEINITAYDFSDPPNPVNLTENTTKIRTFWDEKTMRAIKPPINSTTVNCAGNECTLTANLSMILQGKGKYNMEMDIVDINGNKKQSSIFFETRGIIVSIPNIKEIWFNGFNDQDTNKRELELRNDRDNCDNQLWMEPNCPFFNSTTNVTYCYGQVNVTTGSIYHADAFGVYCVTARGEWQQGLCQDSQTGIAFASNSTHLAYNTNCNSNVTCELTNSLAVNDTFNFDNKNWIIVSIGNSSQGENTFAVKNSDGICGEKECNQDGCIGYVLTPPPDHATYSTAYHGYVRNLIEKLQHENWWFAENFPAFNYTREVYVYHNTTHVWLSDSDNLSLVPAHAIND